ncbi:MAG: PIG-L family deacetylase [Candidatus Bathyarchaeota archaeon]|nr:PIG-L family deacetylase [Candidatus Bathyarchaeota archaeon]
MGFSFDENTLAGLNYDEAYKIILASESKGLSGVFDVAQKILCIQPHPDDVDIAAGGLVAKLAERGCEIAYVTMTDGGAGTLDQEMYPEKLASIRVLEEEEAAKILGVKKLVWMNYKDSELKPSIEIRNRLISLIREFQPHVILTVDPWLTYEAHPDHVATGILTVEAMLFAMFPHINPWDIRAGLKPHLTPFVAFYWTRKPNIYVDITGYIDVKFRAISAHKSQFPPERFSEIENNLRIYSMLMGKKISVMYAEAFKVLFIRHLHCCTYAEDL